MSFKNESADDKIEKLEKKLTNINNNSIEFKRNIEKDIEEVKDKIINMDHKYQNEVNKLKTCKDLLESKNEAIQNIENKFNIEKTKLYEERDSISTENRNYLSNLHELQTI